MAVAAAVLLSKILVRHSILFKISTPIGEFAKFGKFRKIKPRAPKRKPQSSRNPNSYLLLDRFAALRAPLLPNSLIDVQSHLVVLCSAIEGMHALPHLTELLSFSPFCWKYILLLVLDFYLFFCINKLYNFLTMSQVTLFSRFLQFTLPCTFMFITCNNLIVLFHLLM